MHQVTRRNVLVAIGALALAAACGSEDSGKQGGATAAGRDGAMADFGVGTQFKSTKPLTFTMLHNIHPAYPVKNDWLFWTELQKRTGVKLALTLIPFADYDQKKAVIITAGDAPMIVPKMYPGQETPFVASGALLPVSEYVDLLPNFKDKVAKWNLQGDIDTLRQEDGRYYLLPGVHQDVWLDYSLAVRTDVLEEIGMPAPTSWDELYTVLKAMKAKHPDNYPFSDRWNIPTPGGNLLNILAQSYGTQGGWTFVNEHGAYWDGTAGKFVYGPAMDQYKQMITYL